MCLEGGKEGKGVLETGLGDGDCLDVLGEGPLGKLVMLRACTWGWGAWEDTEKEGWSGPGLLQCTG